MTDLTKLTTPFGLLDPETQEALRKWEHGVEAYGHFGWGIFGGKGSWDTSRTYRARPDPIVPDSINWDHVAPEWKWMARDKTDEVWFFDEKPESDYAYWCAKDGMLVCAGFASYRRGTVAWQDSLVERPA